MRERIRGEPRERRRVEGVHGEACALARAVDEASHRHVLVDERVDGATLEEEPVDRLVTRAPVEGRTGAEGYEGTPRDAVAAEADANVAAARPRAAA